MIAQPPGAITERAQGATGKELPLSLVSRCLTITPGPVGSSERIISRSRGLGYVRNRDRVFRASSGDRIDIPFFRFTLEV